MTHKTVEMVLASAVATDGTFTVTYPSGTSKGDFIKGTDHRMTALQADHRVGKGFTIALGDTSATITWKGTTTIPASTRVWVQLDMAGRDYRDEVILKRAVPSNPMLFDLGSPDTADPDGILVGASATDSAQTYTLTDFTAAFQGADAMLDVPRNLTATGTAGSDHVITLTFKDEYGHTVVETLTLNGTNVIAGKKACKTLVSVAVAAGASGDTFDLGWGDVLGLPFFLRDPDMILAEYENGGKVGTAPTVVHVPWELEETELLAGTSEFVVAPVAGEITGFEAVTQKAVGTGGAVTLELATVAVTGASITVADSASPGDRDSSTAITGANTVSAGDAIEIVPASAFATSGELNGYVEITGSGTGMGTYVSGVQSAGSGTSGDVRGTFDPTTACDGVTSFALVAMIDDPNYIGAPQYTG